MLPRTESIFSIGGEEEMISEDTTNYKISRSSVLKTSRIGTSPESLVGLQILLQQQQHHHASNIVNKMLVRSYSLKNSRFLKGCFFCGKELSLQKDVYMYRGDQGFCSVECRCQQILLDERGEFEASKREWRRMQHHQCVPPKIRPSNRRITLGA